MSMTRLASLKGEEEQIGMKARRNWHLYCGAAAQSCLYCVAHCTAAV